MLLLVSILSAILRYYSYALVVYVIMSWFPRTYQTWFGRQLAQLIQPYLNCFSFIKPLGGILDLRALVAFLVLDFAQYLLLTLV
ncbi:YggT family protein [Leuconostocaceae bacterium ESL0958]|nr:YggT family protein [Leuconostocaceae bacterium ESL0958]